MDTEPGNLVVSKLSHNIYFTITRMQTHVASYEEDASGPPPNKVEKA